ncbi:hypothetical protein RYX36_009585, partial [Vicia faba]
MVHTLFLMASHIYPSPLAFPTTHVKECQTFAPSSLAKPDMLNCQYPFLNSSPFGEPVKTRKI